jgi:hypothetical protein
MLARQEAILVHREANLGRSAYHTGVMVAQEILLAGVWTRCDPKDDLHPILQGDRRERRQRFGERHP